MDFFEPINPYEPWLISGHDPYKGLSDGQRTSCSIRHGAAFFLIIVILILVAGMFTGCSTVKESSFTEHHRMETMIDRMESLLSSHTVVQQDSAWRETILRQFESIREKSDTNHVVVTDTAGNILREKLIINHVREVTSESDRQEIRMLSHRLHTMDSTMNLMRQQIQHSDSLLQLQSQVKTVKSSLSWWQQLQLWLGRVAIVALAVIAVIWRVRRMNK